MLVKDLNAIAVNNGTSIKRMRNAINRVMDASTQELREAGKLWYKSAYDECVDIALNSPYTINQVTAAVAQLSPRQHWSKNIEYARQVIETGDAPCLKRSVNMAKLALASDNPIETFSPTALKTRSFYYNLMQDYSHVTVDTWAARIAMDMPDAEKILGRKNMYHAISHAYKLSARDYELSPAETQAVAWCTLRGSAH